MNTIEIVFSIYGMIAIALVLVILIKIDKDNKRIKKRILKEVKHGEWQITDAYPHNVYCSECHERFAQTHWAVWEDGSLPRNFCPNCGADMRKRGEIK